VLLNGELRSGRTGGHQVAYAAYPSVLYGEHWSVPLDGLVHLWCSRFQPQRGGLIVAWGTRPRSTGKRPLCPDGALHLFRSLRQSTHVCDVDCQPFLVGQGGTTRALPGPTMSCTYGARTRRSRGRPGLG